MSTLNPTAIAALIDSRRRAIDDAVSQASNVAGLKKRLAEEEAAHERALRECEELGDALGLTRTEQEADYQAARARRKADAERLRAQVRGLFKRESVETVRAWGGTEIDVTLANNSVNDDAVQ